MQFATGQVSRRTVLAGVPAVMLGGLAASAVESKRPKLAALVTEYRKYSHGQNIVDRFLEGYGWESEHHDPAMDVVSLYVDQFPSSDLSKERVQRFPGMKLYPTIEAALTCGADKLAVDGVLLIAEHGNYAKNEKGQTLYPRYEFFQKTVEVFRKSGKSVPVFVDKHLSWNWPWAKEMVETPARLGFPLLAGSSLPVTWRVPSIDMPLGAEIEEALAVGPGGIDSYDIHALETLQCMVERRRGGETGVKAVQALRGERAWQAARGGSWDRGGWAPELLEACLCRSFMLKPPRDGFALLYPTVEQMTSLCKDPVVYRIEYADGLKGTMLLLDPVVGDITFAARMKGQPEILSTQMYLGAGHEMQPNFFNPLVHHIESLMLTRRSPYPIERTLLTTGLTAAGVESLWQGQKRLDTPHLAIRYQPTAQSTFRRS